MTTDKQDSDATRTIGADAAGRKLSPQARRALEEAAARRAAKNAAAAKAMAARKEIGGCDGPEPVRYGDWEVKGRASDF